MSTLGIVALVVLAPIYLVAYIWSGRQAWNTTSTKINYLVVFLLITSIRFLSLKNYKKRIRDNNQIIGTEEDILG